MMPITPKTSVSPEATRKSRSPYWTPFSSWISSDATSTPHLERRAGGPLPARAPRGSHLAAARGVGERRDRDPDHLVLLSLDPAQVDVVHGVVRPGERHRTS